MAGVHQLRGGCPGLQMRKARRKVRRRPCPLRRHQQRRRMSRMAVMVAGTNGVLGGPSMTVETRTDLD
eukprot:1141018-Pelagomonas_calceolata.AAC.11